MIKSSVKGYLDEKLTTDNAFRKNLSYAVLSLFEKHSSALQVWMNDRNKQRYKQDTQLVYYDVTNYYFETQITSMIKKKKVCPKSIVPIPLFKWPIYGQYGDSHHLRIIPWK